MMKTIRPLLLLMPLLLCSACYHSIHDYAENPEPSADMGYLAAQLNYEYPEDLGTPVNNLNIHIFGNGGPGPSEDFGSIDEASDWLQQLPVGEYDVLVTQDMTAADGYSLQGGVVSLPNPASSPDQSWYAMAHVTVRKDEVTVADFELQRLMAALELNVSNVPEGTTIEVTVDHAAASVDLMSNDYRGRLGQPSADFKPVEFGHATQGTGTRSISLTTGRQRLLPTSRDFDRTYIDLWVTTPQGRQLFCLGDTPRMESGHTYVIDLDYTRLKPYMHIEWYRIDDWTEGAVITGEVEVPE